MIITIILTLSSFNFKLELQFYCVIYTIVAAQQHAESTILYNVNDNNQEIPRVSKIGKKNTEWKHL